MNINDLLKATKEFFDMMNPNFCDDYVEDIELSELWEFCEDFFYQFRQQV
jgi:hypothetical protein